MIIRERPTTPDSMGRVDKKLEFRARPHSPLWGPFQEDILLAERAKSLFSAFLWEFPCGQRWLACCRNFCKQHCLLGDFSSCTPCLKLLYEYRISSTKTRLRSVIHSVYWCQKNILEPGTLTSNFHYRYTELAIGWTQCVAAARRSYDAGFTLISIQNSTLLNQ